MLIIISTSWGEKCFVLLLIDMILMEAAATCRLPMHTMHAAVLYSNGSRESSRKLMLDQKRVFFLVF